ncbi:MAG: zinc-binding dehydrogenase [Actinomycetota bacterium]
MYGTERVYHGSAGWSVEVPAGWRVLPFDMSKGDVSVRGAQISNVELPPPEIQPGLPIQTSGLVLPPDGVSLIIAADLDPNIPLIEAGGVTTVVDRTFDLVESPDAVRYLAEGHPAGKIVVTV